MKPKRIKRTEDNSVLTQRLHNKAAKALDQAKILIKRSNKILARGDKEVILADLDPKVITIYSTMANLVSIIEEEQITSDLCT